MVEPMRNKALRNMNTSGSRRGNANQRFTSTSANNLAAQRAHQNRIQEMLDARAASAASKAKSQSAQDDTTDFGSDLPEDTASGIRPDGVPRDRHKGGSYDPQEEPPLEVVEEKHPPSTTSSSDDWAFPERPLERLSRKQKVRRIKENKVKDKTVVTRTKDQLENQRFGMKFHELMRPLYIFLFAQGRFPFRWKDNLDGTYYFTGGWEQWRAIWFNIVSWIINFALVSTTYNGLAIILSDGPGHLSVRQSEIVRVRERVIAYRHVNLYFAVLSALIHSVFVSLKMYFRSDMCLRYFSFWSEALQHLRIDVTFEAFRFRNIVFAVGAVVLVMLIVLSGLRLTGSAAGSSAMMGYFMFRMTKTDILIRGEDWRGGQWNPGWWSMQIVGGILYFLTLVWSKSYMFFFVLKVKCLRNAFATWNGRLYSAMLRGGNDARVDSGRTTLGLLYRDHNTLLDLLDCTDEFFGSIIESYLITQMWSICFENYFLIRSLKYGFKYGDQYFRRGPEIITAFLLCGHNLATLYVVLMLGSEVGEEALSGLEVLRRRTMMGAYDDEEFCFLFSMYASYSAYREPRIQGSGFFYFTKTSLAAVFSIIGCFTVVVFQFALPFDYSSPETRHQAGYWLRIIEPWTNLYMCRSWNIDLPNYKECFRQLADEGFQVDQFYEENPDLNLENVW